MTVPAIAPKMAKMMMPSTCAPVNAIPSIRRASRARPATPPSPASSGQPT